MITQKYVQMLKCDGCGHWFSEKLMGHYESEFGEADYCDSCASTADAKYGV